MITFVKLSSPSPQSHPQNPNLLLLIWNSGHNSKRAGPIPHLWLDAWPYRTPPSLVILLERNEERKLTLTLLSLKSPYLAFVLSLSPLVHASNAMQCLLPPLHHDASAPCTQHPSRIPIKSRPDVLNFISVSHIFVTSQNHFYNEDTLQYSSMQYQ